VAVGLRVPRKTEGVLGWAVHRNRVMWVVPPNTVAVVAGVVGLRVPRKTEGVLGWAVHLNRVMWGVPPNMAVVRQVVPLNMAVADLLEAEVAKPFNPAEVHYHSLSLSLALAHSSKKQPLLNKGGRTWNHHNPHKDKSLSWPEKVNQVKINK